MKKEIHHLREIKSLLIREKSEQNSRFREIKNLLISEKE